MSRFAEVFEKPAWFLGSSAYLFVWSICLQTGLSNVQYTREAGFLHTSKAQGRAFVGITKISHQESNVKGVGVCGYIIILCAFLKI